MRKLFGRNKKGPDEHKAKTPSLPSDNPHRTSQPSSKASHLEVLSVKPAYLSLESFTFPVTAHHIIASARDEEIVLDRCRRCSDCYVHTFKEWTTRVIVGIPKTDDYRAISYVWGDTIPLPMKCSHCGHKFRVPMESAYRFRRLMMMTAKSGQAVWLDALSIDQTDNEDKRKIIAVMGDIYSRASMVSVLFPIADGEGFQTVYDLTVAATAINKHKLEFSQVGQDGHPKSRLTELTKVCQDFYNMLDHFDRSLHKYTYWRRAWTFQEWALSRNISITWEGGMSQNMESVKTTILHAATLTAIYAFSNGAYATIKLGFPQADVPGRFEKFKRLFPDEQAFCPAGTLDEKQISFDMMMPSMRFGSALGLRAAWGPDLSRIGSPQPIHEMYYLRPDLPESEDERFRHRLCMALSTFGISKREARYEADLVNCWASMCNIKFPYDANDSYAAAIQKVLHSIRTDHKVRIYNFLVSTTGASGEVDINFQEYACQHEQCNASLANSKFNDIPIFSGRADTGVHFRLAMNRPITPPRLKSSGVELRKIKNAFILFVARLTDHDQVMQNMARAVSGTADNFVFGDVSDNISKILQSTPRAQLSRSSLAIVRIPLDSPDANKIGKIVGMVTWAIIPSDLDNKSCFVAREGLNGTLVLAAPGSGALEVMAYLTLTDHQSGTLLIPVEAHELGCRCKADHSRGQIQMTLKSPIRRGVQNSALMGDRMIRGSIPFEAGRYVAH